MAEQFKWEIKQHLAVLSRNENTGWSTEANIVSWNDGPDKLDIRAWNPEHDKMAKGVTLTEGEARILASAINRTFEGR